MNRYARCLCTILLAWNAIGLASAWGQASATSSSGPDAAAISFYRWYIHELAADHDPLLEDRERMKAYISTPLLREVKRRMSSPDGLDADYFIQAQDYLNEWIDHVQAEGTKIGAAGASTVIVLGGPKEPLYRLSVRLVHDGGAWKIRRVRRLHNMAEEDHR